MMEAARIEPSLDLAVKSFINKDGSVDGEMRIGNLPAEWMSEEGAVLIAAFLSNIFRAVGTLSPGEEGGRYFVSIGCRFGPQNDSDVGDLAELYKKFRGMFQIAAYHTVADILSGIMNNVVAIEEMMKNLWSRRGLPAVVIFVRVTWTPDGTKPARYEGERGGGQ